MGLWGESGDDWSGKHFHAKFPGSPLKVALNGVVGRVWGRLVGKTFPC